MKPQNKYVYNEYNEYHELEENLYVYGKQEMPRVSEWSTMDTEELFKKNMSRNKQQMLRLGWDKRKITYELNDYYFRSDEFDVTQESVMFLGCSYTFGIGIPLKDTWAYQVSRELGLRCYNLGQPGTGADTCFRLGSYWIPRLRPSFVVLLIPEITRIDLLLDNKTDSLGVWREDYIQTKPKSFYQNYISTDKNGELNRLKNRLALRYIASSCNIKLVEIECEDYLHEQCEGDKARDLRHPGIKSNYYFYKRVVEILKEQ